MRESDLIGIIRSHRRDSLGYQDGELSAERARALDHYHGRPYGNEQEGRSAVVSKDLSEAVDWAMPAILRVFTQSGNVAEFDPVGPEDERLAQQESDVVNKVFMDDNNGFMVLHDAIKDALLLKNGYVKHYWSETEEIETEDYSGLTMQEVATLVSGLEAEGATVEIVGQEARQVMVETTQGGLPLEVFDIKLKIARKTGKVVCEPVPPEELRVAKTCRGPLKDAAFVEHVTYKTRSELLEMGMPRDFVDSLPAYQEADTDSETLARDSVADESDSYGMAFVDRSMDVIEYCEAYIRVDWDGDGIAELRKVITCADRIPPGAEWNEPIDMLPISGGVPKRIPHRHVGESLDDDIADLQEIKTTLLRQMLDNIYITNNNQWVVNERVNLSDFLQSLPGGVKRVRGLEPVSGSVEPIMSPPIMQQIMPAIDYIDNTKEARTGINRATTGLDPDILKQSTKGAFIENLNRASQKIEMITRMLAETLVKPTLLAVHALLVKHQDKPMVTRLRGEFVQINPQEWRKRQDMRIRVGLGTGSEEEKREKLAMLAQMLPIVGQQGLVGPMQAYNLFADMVKAMGFDMPEKYAMSPQSPEYQQKMQQPPPPDPLIVVEQMKLQAKQQETQATIQLEQQKAQADLQQEQVRSQNDVAIEQAKMMAQIELEKWKAELKAQTDLAMKRMQVEAELALEQIRAQAEPKQPISIVNDAQGTYSQSVTGEFAAALERMFEQQQAQMAHQQAQMEKLTQILTRPRQIVRGPDGKAIGVQ